MRRDAHTPPDINWSDPRYTAAAQLAPPSGTPVATIKAWPGAAVALEEADAPSTGVDSTLAQRGERYGSFARQGRIEQNIKSAFRDTPNWSSLADDSKSALEMIATKISRILQGDPAYSDSWHDIVGYAKLIDDRLKSEGK